MLLDRRFFIQVLFFVTTTAWAQEEVLVNAVGTKLGSRTSFVENCRKQWSADPAFSIFDWDKFCDCMVPIVLSTPVVASNDNPKVLELIDLGAILSNSPTAFDELAACTELDMSGIRLSTMGEEVLDEMRDSCADQLRVHPTIKGSGTDAVKLCSCLVQAIKERDLTVGGLQVAMDPNSPLFNEVLGPCAMDAMPSGPAMRHSPDDITGLVAPVTIPVVVMGKVHKVKVRVGGADHYFVIDSGAEDCFVSSGWIAQMEAAGAIDRNEQLSPREYQFADGSTKSCKRYVLNGMEVGPLRVDRVVVASIDKDIQYLLGKSFLQKFAKWHVDEAERTLTLER